MKDRTALDAEMAATGLDAAALTGICLLYTSAYAPKILVWEDGALRKKFGWHTPAMGPDYRAFLRAFLPALTAFFKDRGMADRVYFHLSDEPELRHLDAYRAAADFVRPLLAGCKTLDALSDYEFYRTGCVERPVVASDHLEPFLAHGVKGLWTYYCIVQKDVYKRQVVP